MGMEFTNVFACERCRVGEIQDKPAVDHFAVDVSYCFMSCDSSGRDFTNECKKYFTNCGARCSHDA